MLILLLQLFFLLFLLIAVAYLTLAERKILGAIQLRRGPAVIGFFGLLQPFADGLKLILKQTVFPRAANQLLFIFAPIFGFTLSLFLWTVIPFSPFAVLADLECGLLFILAISSLNVYSIVLAGWSSNSKYAFLGAIRSAAQMVSYELTMGVILLTLLLAVGSLNVSSVVYAQVNSFFCVPFFPLSVIFFIATLAETNRTPFDLPEAEAELVAGYNVEYSSMAFALFFLSEYANMIFMSAFTSILFFGGWLPVFTSFSFIPPAVWFGFKICLLLFVFIWVRATFQRYRYDQLMRLGWKVFLPITFCYFFVTAFLLKFIV